MQSLYKSLPASLKELTSLPYNSYWNLKYPELSSSLEKENSKVEGLTKILDFKYY